MARNEEIDAKMGLKGGNGWEKKRENDNEYNESNQGQDVKWKTPMLVHLAAWGEKYVFFGHTPRWIRKNDPLCLYLCNKRCLQQPYECCKNRK